MVLLNLRNSRQFTNLQVLVNVVALFDDQQVDVGMCCLEVWREIGFEWQFSTIFCAVLCKM